METSNKKRLNKPLIKDKGTICNTCHEKFATPYSLTRHQNGRNACNPKNIKEVSNDNLEKKVEDLMEKLSKFTISTYYNDIISLPAKNSMNVNFYKNPDLENVSLDENKISKAISVSQALIIETYFNPNIPENHSICLDNHNYLCYYIKFNEKAIVKKGIFEVINDIHTTLIKILPMVLNNSDLTSDEKYNIKERFYQKLNSEDTLNTIRAGQQLCLKSERFINLLKNQRGH